MEIKNCGRERRGGYQEYFFVDTIVSVSIDNKLLFWLVAIEYIIEKKIKQTIFWIISRKITKKNYKGLINYFRNEKKKEKNY